MYGNKRRKIGAGRGSPGLFSRWLTGSVTLLAVLILFALSGSARAAGVAGLIITESWDEYHRVVSFTATNTYPDILEFAIGNNFAQEAWIEEDTANSEYITDALVARRGEDGLWYAPNDYGYRPLTWLDNADGFENYNRAFLFTSWDDEETGYRGYLEWSFPEPFTTNGYRGQTVMPSSPFAAYSEANGVANPITGETSPVPIPGAVWLLGSGLLGLVAVRRKKSGAK